METNYEKKRETKNKTAEKGLIDLVFSWSINDVLNRNLYKDKVKKIPMEFSSEKDYLQSFIDPLVEEVHADLLSSMKTIYRAPSSRILDIRKSSDFKFPCDLCYQINTLQTDTRNERNNIAGYMPGDLIVITDIKPRSPYDLPNTFHAIAHIERVEDDGRVFVLSIRSSKPIQVVHNLLNKKGNITLYAFCLINMITSLRMWKALHPDSEENMKIIQRVLQPKFVDVVQCSLCSNQAKCPDLSLCTKATSSDLNEPQQAAVLSCIAMKECNHLNSVKLIWGPPGTGKTKTIAFLLDSLYMMKCRTLACAPTNNAVLEVTERLLKKVTESFEYNTYGLGDLVLFGNAKRLKIDESGDLLDVFLDRRANILSKCFEPNFGWNGSLIYVISLLENPIDHYLMYLKDWIGGNNVDEVEDRDKNGENEEEEKDNYETSDDENNESKKGKKKVNYEITKKKIKSEGLKNVIAQLFEKNKNIKKPEDINQKSEHEEEKK